MAVAGYEYRIDGGPAVDVGNVLSHLVTGLTPSTAYDFEIRSYDGAGNRSGWSSPPVTETTNAGVTFMNVALSANGSSATATATGGGNVSNLINGTHTAGGSWPAGGWDAGTQPATVEIDFGQSRDVTRLDVFTIRDTYNDVTEPTLVETFASFGIRDYTIDYWNGSTWVNVVTVTANDKVWRQHTVSSFTSTKIRLVGTLGADSTSIRLVEIEAWGDN